MREDKVDLVFALLFSASHIPALFYFGICFISFSVQERTGLLVMNIDGPSLPANSPELSLIDVAALTRPTAFAAWAGTAAFC